MASVEKPVRRGEEPTLIFGDGKPFGLNVVEAAAAMESDSTSLASQGLYTEIDLLRGAVRSLRNSKDKFSKEAVEGVNDCFAEETADMAIKAMRPKSAKKDVMHWLATASNEEFANFCQWNVARYAVRQQATDRVTKGLQANTMRKIEHLVSVNFLPKHVRTAHKKLIEKNGSILAFDSFDAGGLGAGAAYYKDQVYMSNGFNKPDVFTGVDSFMRNAAFHEYMHAAGDGLKGGFYYSGIKSKKTRGLFSWVEESFVAHCEDVASVLGKSEAKRELIIPNKRSHDVLHNYVKERELLGLTAQYGPKPIAVDQMVEAYFSEVNAQNKSRRDLENKFVTNFQTLFPKLGEDGFYDFSGKYADAASTAKAKLLSSAISKATQRLGIEGLIESVEPDAA